MKPIPFDLDSVTEATGPLFGGESEDLDFTLVQWSAGGGVAEHLNSEVDVLMIVVTGEGAAVVDGESIRLRAGQALLIPKSMTRRIESGGEPFRYLNIHKRRRRLMPGSLSSRPAPRT